MKYRLHLGVNHSINPDCDLIVALGLVRDAIKKLDIDENILILITREK